VASATRAGETQNQRQKREQREAAARMAAEAEERDAMESARQAALQAEAKAQSERPPLTVDEWNAHVVSGIMPCITYFTERVNNKDGDRFEIVEFFRGARIFDPAYAKTLNPSMAKALIEKLRPFHALNDDNAEGGNIIELLKTGWSAYRQNAVRVIGKFDFDKDEAAILSWHYQMFLRLGKEQREDNTKKHCRYCGCRSRNCLCYKSLHAWWYAARLCALVMPSSAATERVFSLLNNLFNNQQTSTLIDSILLSLFLSHNKRKVVVPHGFKEIDTVNGGISKNSGDDGSNV